jgi:hypothetical protein
LEANRGTRYLANYDALLFQNTDGDGARITFEFEVDREDVYDIDLLPNKAPSYGMYSYAIDGEVLGVYDFYGAAAPNAYSTLATMRLTAGKHTLTFEYAGKSPQSTGHYAAFKRLSLITEEERDERDRMSRDTQRGLWVYYGRNTGHGHKDTLNLGLHMYGMDLAPDLGYPDVTGNDPKRIEWTSNTIAHNTVVVNREKQRNQVVGIPHHFDGDGQVQLFDVEAPLVYPDADVYRRTVSLIRVDDEYSYAADFFRVEGGSSHHYSFHSGDGTVSAEGLALVPQKNSAGQYVGTYAGADIPYAATQQGWYTGTGFHYLQNVDRAAQPQAPFSVDWKVNDTFSVHEQDPDVHLRLTMLNDVDEVALADGEPPQNNARSPEAVRYMIAARTGENLKSTFTSIIEPYKGERRIESIQLASVQNGGVEVADESVRAVKVQLKNGRTDYIMYSLDPNTVYTIDGRIAFKGFFGVYSELDGEPVYAYVTDGTRIGKIGEELIDRQTGRLEGTVESFSREMSVENEIVVRMDVQGIAPEQLAGKVVYVETDGVRNGAYRIESVEALGNDRYRLDIGNMTLIRAYADPNDFSAGYLYDIAAGAAFYIPLDAEAAVPITRAFVNGEVRGGWYGQDTAVKLEVYGSKEHVSYTEYSLDGGTEWRRYEAPIVLSETGEHTLLYRSLSTTGHAEREKRVTVRVDATAPAFVLKVNGISVADRIALSDAQTVTVDVYASDAHSGVESVAVTVNGEVYEQGTPIDFAGRLGEHLVEVTVADAAGNAASAAYTLEIAASIDGMLQLAERFAAAGELAGPLVPQIMNSLQQAKHHLENGRPEQAAHHLRSMIQRMNNLPQAGHISEKAKRVLETDALSLIEKWTMQTD